MPFHRFTTFLCPHDFTYALQQQAAFHDLFWSVGDGGPQNDLSNRGQDVNEYHGTIVRISVSSAAGQTGYEIPSDNPFASGGNNADKSGFGISVDWTFGLVRDKSVSGPIVSGFMKFVNRIGDERGGRGRTYISMLDRTLDGAHVASYGF